MKLVPVIVTEVPPAVGPVFGTTELTVGAPAYVNWSAPLVGLVPPGVVTVTSTTPLPAGLVAAMCVGSVTLKEAAVPPNVTAVAPVKLVPVIVTGVPPEVDPVPGDTEDMVGGGGGGVT
jgi:hypothetical protein